MSDKRGREKNGWRDERSNTVSPHLRGSRTLSAGIQRLSSLVALLAILLAVICMPSGTRAQSARALLDAPQLPDKPQPHATVKIGIDYPKTFCPSGGTVGWCAASTEYVDAPVPHRTADHDYLALNLSATLLTAGDIASAYAQPGREINPLVMRKSELAVQAAITAGVWYFSWRYKRQDDAARAIGVKLPRVKWYWLPLAPIAEHGIPLILNLAESR